MNSSFIVRSFNSFASCAYACSGQGTAHAARLYFWYRAAAFAGLGSKQGGGAGGWPCGPRWRCLGWPGAWAWLALAVIFSRPRWLPRRSAFLALLPGCPSLALLAALLGPSCRLPYMNTAGGLRGLKNGASWPRLAGLASHTADAWRLPLPRLPWRYKDSASGFLGGSLPGLPCGPGSLPFLAFVLPLKKGGGLAGWRLADFSMNSACSDLIRACNLRALGAGVIKPCRLAGGLAGGL